MADVKRVDTGALRAMATRLRVEGGQAEDEDTIAEMLSDAILEIEAARAAPPPSPASDRSRIADAVAALPSAFVALATHILDRVERAREAGPSRATRLVAYRCAALTKFAGDFADDASKSGEYRCAWRCEEHAHAMLAAEWEAP